jgi:hypothetical protein
MSSESSIPLEERAWASKLLLFGLGGLAALYALTSLTWPLGWDQGIMAWVGSVIASGGLPFRDAWDPKGPASYLPFAAASAVGGQVALAYRVAELLLLAGGALAAAKVVRALGLRGAAPVTAFALVLTQASLGYQNTLQPDQWAGWLLAGAVAFTLGRPRGYWPGILAGGLIGIAALIKPQFGLTLLVPLADAWTRVEQSRWTRLGAIILGAATPVLACLAWFGTGDAIYAFVDGYLLSNLEARLDSSGQIVPVGRALPIAIAAMPYLLPLAIAAGVGIAACWRSNRRNASLLLAWLSLTVAGVALQGRWYPYVWTPLIPPLLVLGIAGLTHLVGPPAAPEPGRLRRPRYLLGVGLGLSALGLATRSLLPESRAAAYLALGRLDRMQYLSRYREGGPNFSAADVVRAAERVSRETSPDECVLVWPEPGVNVLAVRRTPARFATVAALTRYERTPRRKRYQAEFLAALELHPPSLILIDNLATAGRPSYVGDLITRFPTFLQFVYPRYDLAGHVGKYAIWVPHHRMYRGCSSKGGGPLDP